MLSLDDLHCTVITQTCFRCYFSNDIEVCDYAVIRGYNPKEDDWDIYLLDDLFEVNTRFKNTTEAANFLQKTYQKVEEITLVEYMNSVVNMSKDIGRWGYSTDNK